METIMGCDGSGELPRNQIAFVSASFSVSDRYSLQFLPPTGLAG